MLLNKFENGGRTDISSASSWLSSMLLVSWNHQIQRKHPKFVNDWTFILFRRSNVPDGPLFRWRLSHIWTWGNCLLVQVVHSTIASHHQPQQCLWTGFFCVDSYCTVFCCSEGVICCAMYNSFLLRWSRLPSKTRRTALTLSSMFSQEWQRCVFRFVMWKTFLGSVSSEYYMSISWVLQSARYKKQDQTGLDRSASWLGFQEVKG